jgi:CTD small phosphatase-like protein 2
MNEINITVEQLNKDKKEDYQIIRENYHSSPKCGIKALFVKKVKNNIIFTPIEISEKPYFKYCVTQIKEEPYNDISQSETNQTKVNDYKTTNTNNYDSTNKVLKIDKINDKEDEEREKESEEAHYIQIVEKKASEITLCKSFKSLEEHKNMEKDRIKISSKFLNSEKDIKYFYHKSLNIKESKKLKSKLSIKKVDTQHKTTLKNNQINIFNILNNIMLPTPIKIKYNNNDSNLVKTQSNKEMNMSKSTLNINFNSKKNKNIKKISSPKDNVNNQKQLKIKFSHSNKIKRLKKEKKTEKNIKVNKKHVKRQYSFIPILKIKKNKLKIEESKSKIDEKEEQKTRRHSMAEYEDKKNKNKIEDKDDAKSRRHSMLPLNENKKNRTIRIDEKDEQKMRRYSMVPLNENKKNSKKIYNNILSKDQKETKNNINKVGSLNKKNRNSGEKSNQITFKIVRYSKKFDYDKCNTPKRKLQYNYKVKADEFLTDLDSGKNQDNSPKKRRKVSITMTSNSGSKKKLKNFREDSRGEISKAKKSTFFSLKDKDKSKEIDKGSIKEKKMKKKKRKKNKQREEKVHEQSVKGKPFRKDKSFSIKTTNINTDLTNHNSEKNNYLENQSKNNNNFKINLSGEKNTNKNETENNRSDVRGNSTKNLYRDNHNREKIIDLTNKQTINNINEYTRQCLRMIPDLYDLKDKMPRCKTKINPDLSKDKKIALFDLDETIVHCIGEINMNNLESLTLQSDAKIKVHLPGGKKEVTVGINVRPHWEEALKRIKEKYHIIAFTASHESYADSVLNYLDPEKKYFQYRLYRCHCVLCNLNDMKFYVKDLKILEDNYDLKDLVLIDNSVLSFAYHLDNGIPISPFYDSKNDTELLTIADFLIRYADEDDIRNKLKEVYKLTEYYEILKDYSSEENEESSDSSTNEKEKNLEKDKINNSSNDNDINLKSVNMNINKDNSDLYLGKTTKKNVSQINLQLKEISNYFKSNEKKEENDNNKNRIDRINGPKRYKYEKKNCLRKLNGKQKTMLLDINFKNIWDEKQNELKNKK